MSLAQVRSSEIVSNFGHNIGDRLPGWAWGEVIAWNSGYDDPVATAGASWRASPPHWSVLTGSYTHIGCGLTISGARYYFACILGIPPAGPAPATVPPPPPRPPTTSLPDTAMPD